MLVESDIGYDLTQEILKSIRKNKGDELKMILKNILMDYLPIDIIDVKNDELYAFLIVGVNGTGKTTSSAKLTKYLINKGCKVSLIAGDTYRAAAIEQLKIWAEKLDVILYTIEKLLIHHQLFLTVWYLRYPKIVIKLLSIPLAGFIITKI